MSLSTHSEPPHPRCCVQRCPSLPTLALPVPELASNATCSWWLPCHEAMLPQPAVLGAISCPPPTHPPTTPPKGVPSTRGSPQIPIVFITHGLQHGTGWAREGIALVEPSRIPTDVVCVFKHLCLYCRANTSNEIPSQMDILSRRIV